jgi:DNA-binding NarL/FixJ family response regulator
MLPNETSSVILRRAARSSVQETRRLTLLIVSEVRFLREALAELLRRDPTVLVLGICATLDEAIHGMVSSPPDIVLLDAGYPDGTTAVRQLRDAVPDSGVVVLAVAETTENIIAWAEAGVIGYVPQTTALADLVKILHGIRNGGQVCSAGIAAGLIRHVAQNARTGPTSLNARPILVLTRREQEISLLIGAGLSNKEIARRLDIGVATAKSHVHNLLSKMNVQSRGQAVARLGLSGNGMNGSR